LWAKVSNTASHIYKYINNMTDSLTSVPQIRSDVDYRDSVEAVTERNRIRNLECLPVIPRIQTPNVQYLAEQGPEKALEAIQEYLNSLTYNYLALPFIQLKRSERFEYLLEQSQEILRASLPIQCVEAVFLGCYLTMSMTSIERIPLSFKSNFGGKEYRHIVLAIFSNNKWGCLGISRRSCLMYKPLVFNSLYELISDMRFCYEKCFHHLLTAYVGLPVPHCTQSELAGASSHKDKVIKWRALKIRLHKRNMEVVKSRVNNFMQPLVGL
jgi:hypothetical protein